MATTVYFLVYDPSTGRGIQSGYCPDTMLDIQASAGAAVIVTDAQVESATSMVVDGKVVAYTPPVDMDSLKLSALATIDADVELVRGRYITLGPGQAMVYQEKRVEAEAVMADPAISPSLVPHIAAEAALNGTTIFGQAQTVIERAYMWVAISALIEPKRVGAKDAVAAAATAAEVAAAVAIDWTDLPSA